MAGEAQGNAVGATALVKGRQYARGADFERLVKADLEGRKYLVVRSAGSRGPVDLMAMKKKRTLLVQATRDLASKPNAELWELRELARGKKAEAFIAVPAQRGGVAYHPLIGDKQP